MKEIEKVLKEVKKITQELIRCGLAEEYNFPVIKNSDVVWTKYSDITRYLKNMDYAAIYMEIEKEHNYNIKLPDGGMIQLMYRFDSRGNHLESHRLAFYPSPSYETYQNEADLYDEDDIYGDVLNRDVMPVVIRADYCRDKIESAVHHPFSHITLGGYKNCRIPADRAVSPVHFVKFILEHFYYVPSSRWEFDFGMKGIIKFDEHMAECDRVKSRVIV